MISVVIPTRNESANITACVQAFEKLARRGDAEVTVVDNFSDDGTQETARKAGAKVLVQGPERCSQRNRGWKESSGDFIMFVDADMIVPESTQEEILRIIAAPDAPDALYVREIRSGEGFRTRWRNFERSFYDATPVDGLRVIRRTFLERVGGYDESLVACEDWDLDRRITALGARTALTDGHLVHNEKNLTTAAHLAKKRYYAGTMDAYRRKWNDDAYVRRQFSPWYRLAGVFMEHGKWRRVLRHPVLYAAVVADRISVGLVYLFARRGQPRPHM